MRTSAPAKAEAEAEARARRFPRRVNRRKSGSGIYLISISNPTEVAAINSAALLLFVGPMRSGDPHADLSVWPTNKSKEPSQIITRMYRGVWFACAHASMH